ncbi:Mitochondrial Carrier (MC) Family [Phytophthora nicotianae]|uniref:Mitochondrial Carrier (MC) Family n=1 Tax=Phytophthora nicotianae TaxID=4792 RepID=A0A0W8D5C0_PHYNI|nr:Mitochondrial Carrier (MC) Family [Phytophthora nicotianae]
MTELFSFASVLNPCEETRDESVVSDHPELPMESSRNRRRNPDPFGKPSELLQRIGLRGKEVVKILKDRDWEVCDPKALQEHKLYYVPGGKAKGDLAVQGEDFFVGEGELYAYILEKAVIIGQAERSHSPERVECAARIGIPGFVSTGSGNLMLMRDIERHLLLIIAAVRQYLRARSTSSYTGGAVSTSKRSDLRALQLNIEKMNAELTELSTIVSTQAETLSQKTSTTPVRVYLNVSCNSSHLTRRSCRWNSTLTSRPTVSNGSCNYN